MNIVVKLATAMLVAQEIPKDGKTCSKNLDGDVPSGAYDLRKRFSQSDGTGQRS